MRSDIRYLHRVSSTSTVNQRHNVLQLPMYLGKVRFSNRLTVIIKETDKAMSGTYLCILSKISRDILFFHIFD